MVSVYNSLLYIVGTQFIASLRMGIGDLYLLHDIPDAINCVPTKGVGDPCLLYDMPDAVNCVHTNGRAESPPQTKSKKNALHWLLDHQSNTFWSYVVLIQPHHNIYGS